MKRKKVCLTDLSMKLESKGLQKHEWWWKIYLWEDISPHDICNQWLPAVCNISQNSSSKILHAKNTAACRRYKHHSNPWHPPVNSTFINMSIHNHTMNSISDYTKNDAHNISQKTWIVQSWTTHVLPTGFFSMRSSVGGSVASARAPSVSIIKLTHKSCHTSHNSQSKLSWTHKRKRKDMLL